MRKLLLLILTLFIAKKPVILYMFYLSQEDLPLAVQHPEIPLE